MTNTFSTFAFFDGKTYEASYGTFTWEGITTCPVCGEIACLRNVELSTGEKLLSGYTPDFGEIVKNNWSECSKCSWNQVS